ncbi:hypothetical protein R3P38DRAFT_3068936 [Favolaschia claudopus]|uniref:F-box domain-containing protein n=1 Tax=Favolaschia claudopus TaxID=2862362 RepID=A0AAW0A0T5_9AGAR
MESRFTHRFGTNYVPTDEEIEEIRADLLCRTEELTRIDERIRELSEQRDKILAYIEPRKALAIFLACLPTGRNAVMSAQEAPLLLCRICSAWRTAALSMPRLWASLHIPIEFVYAKSDTRRPAVEQWLTERPLLLCSASWGVTSSSEVAALVNFNVEFTWMTDSDAAAQALAGIHAPRLESDLSHFDQVLNSSRLRALALVPTLPIAWHQLTTLGYSSISLADIISLFGRCPQLVVKDSSFDYRSLSFTVVPSYRYFHNWYLACIMDCVKQIYPLLEDLAIHLASLNSQALLNVLHSFPALTRLVVNACPLLRGDGDAWNSNWDSSRNSSGTARLLETLLDTTVCPHLQELEIMEAKTLNKNILVDLSISFQTAWDESKHSTIPHLSPAESEYYCSLGLNAPSPWTGLQM